MKTLERQQVLDAIPTNWLDPLLTGPDKALPNSHAYTTIDIERLLKAIRTRILELSTIEVS